MTPIYLPVEEELPPEEEPEPLNEADDFGEDLQPEETNGVDAEDPGQSIPAEDELLGLEEAVKQIPAELKEQMEDLLRAEFREVIRWQEPSS